MIATVDIALNAAQPWQPLAEFSAFVNSPSQVRVTGVPSAIGNWRITKLYASVAYPDNTLHTIELVPGGVAPESQPQSTEDTVGGSRLCQGSGVQAGASPQLQNSPVSPALCGQNTPLTATLPASTSPGSNPKGFQILADGIDESGNIVTGYALGVGPLTIMPRDGIIVVGDTRYYFHLVDTIPANPKTGDACVIDGVLKWYNGTSWQPFGGAQIVAPSTDPEDAGKAADAYATGMALAARPTKAQVEAGWWSAWTILRDGVDVTSQVQQPEYISDGGGDEWHVYVVPTDELATYPSEDDADASELSWKGVDTSEVFHDYTATRHRVSSPVPTKPSDIGAQPAISDLAAIRSGAAAGATAVQPSALAGAVRYDLGAASAATTPVLPTDAFPVSYTFDVTYTDADMEYARLIWDETSSKWLFQSQLVNIGEPSPQYETICSFDSSGAFSAAASGVIGLTFGDPALSSPPSLIFPVQMSDRAVQKVTLNAASTTLVLPALSDSDKVADFGIDVVNAYEESGEPAAASFQLSGTLGTDYNLIVPKGETWSDMTALAEGEMAVYYFTLSAFQIDDLPTWEVMKKVVEPVPVPAAP